MALTGEKNRIQTIFNGITLETFDGKKSSLLGYTPAYSLDHFKSFKHGLVSRLHDATELERITDYVTTFKYDAFNDTYTRELLQLKQYLLDRLPSKKAELDQMAQADAAEKQRLEQQRIQREKDEEIRLQQEESNRLKKEEESIAAKQSQNETMALFSGVAEAASGPAPETRQGYEIIVKHAGAWVMMFQFWFQKEGVNLSIDKFGGKKLDSIKTYCETYAHKHGEKIESPYLSYESTYKAVNRKVTA